MSIIALITAPIGHASSHNFRYTGNNQHPKEDLLRADRQGLACLPACLPTWMWSAVLALGFVFTRGCTPLVRVFWRFFSVVSDWSRHILLASASDI